VKDPEAFVLSLIDYISSSLSLEENKKPILVADIKDWLKRNFGPTKESRRFTSFNNFRY